VILILKISRYADLAKTVFSAENDAIIGGGLAALPLYCAFMYNDVAFSGLYLIDLVHRVTPYTGIVVVV